MNKIGRILHKMHESVSMDPAKAAMYFKTGKGQYAEKDKFIGVRVPDIRKIANKYKAIPLDDIAELLRSGINEVRRLGLIILVMQFQKRNIEEKTRRHIFQFYLTHVKSVNNWNLVDGSAHHIVGAYLFDKDTDLLFDFASSDNMWKRRIAIVATWYFIRQGETDLTFKLAEKLLQDDHDLMHKATGWMLREAGKKNEARLVEFLQKHEPAMPRTMYRYAIERLDRPLSSRTRSRTS